MRISDEYAIARERLSADDLAAGIQPPLTETELRYNFDQASAFATMPPGESMLLLRPLPVEQGGRFHGQGGDIFPTRDNESYRAIEDWMHGQTGGCE